MRISIVLPVYNVEKYIRQCLDSLINQTADLFEVIAINDGSKDKSLDILKEYQNKFKYFKIIDQENSGLSVARNSGIKEASGEYVIFLDSDDMLRKDAIEKILTVVNENDVDLICFDALRFDDETNKQYSNIPERKNIFKESIMDKETFLLGCKEKCLLMSTLHCYKVDILKSNNVKFIAGLLHEDEYHSLTSYRFIKRVAYIEEQLYIRRFRKNSIMTGNIYSNYASLNSYLKILNQLNSDIVKYNIDGTLRELIKDRSSLILSNLIRYDGINIKYIVKVSKEINVDIKWIRLILNIIVFKSLKKLKREKYKIGDR